MKADPLQTQCGYCKNQIRSLCLDCENRACKVVGDTDEALPLCEAVFGQCGHVYHAHCIRRWLDKSSKCMTCGSGAFVFQCFEEATASDAPLVAARPVCISTSIFVALLRIHSLLASSSYPNRIVPHFVPSLEPNE